MEEIARIFSEKDAENATLYKKKCRSICGKTKKLDTQAKRSFASIEERTKNSLVTSEGAFKYFHEHMICQQLIYGRSIQKVKGTPDQMKAIVDRIRARSTGFIQWKTSVDSRSMERVAKETGLKIYDKLFTDSIAKRRRTKEILTIR